MSVLPPAPESPITPVRQNLVAAIKEKIAADPEAYANPAKLRSVARKLVSEQRQAGALLHRCDSPSCPGHLNGTRCRIVSSDIAQA